MLSAITPNWSIMKSPMNWVLVALILFLVGVVVHLFASQVPAANNLEGS